MSDTQMIADRPATSHLTTPMPGDTAPAWWDGEHATTRAVLDFAWLRGDAGNDAFDRIVALFAPTTGASFVDLAETLYRLERLDCGDLDGEVGGEAAAEDEAARLKADAVTSAQLIASLIRAGVR